MDKGEKEDDDDDDGRYLFIRYLLCAYNRSAIVSDSGDTIVNKTNTAQVELADLPMVGEDQKGVSSRLEGDMRVHYMCQRGYATVPRYLVKH